MGLMHGQFVNPHNLHGKVVGTALRVGGLHQLLCDRLQIARSFLTSMEHADYGLGVEVFVDPIGGQEKDIARLQRLGLVVDLDLRIDAQRTAQVALTVADPHAVVGSQLLQRVAAQPVNARVAHMEYMGSGRFEDHGAERAHIATVLVVAVLAMLGLRMQPGVGCIQNPLGRGLDRPGVRGAVVVLQKTGNCVLAGHLADRAAADAVGQRQRNALCGELWLVRNVGAMKVLIDLLAPFLRTLPYRNFQSAGHGAADYGNARLGAVFRCVVYRVRPVNDSPPTRLPSTVGISFQIR